MKTTPDYCKIYKDLLLTKYPEKLSLVKDKLQNLNTSLSIISLDNSISSKNLKSNEENQRSRVYDDESIKQILECQRKEHLNNSQLALKFNISRNTVGKWRKIYAKII